MINWKIRVQNKTFWITLIPAIILTVQAVLKLFNVQLDLSNVSNNLLEVVNTIFVVLTITGIVVDPTTHGVSDSNRALDYDKPHKD